MYPIKARGAKYGIRYRNKFFKSLIFAPFVMGYESGGICIPIIKLILIREKSMEVHRPHHYRKRYLECRCIGVTPKVD
jgi:hypothetical protein